MLHQMGNAVGLCGHVHGGGGGGDDDDDALVYYMCQCWMPSIGVTCVDALPFME